MNKVPPGSYESREDYVETPDVPICELSIYLSPEKQIAYALILASLYRYRLPREVSDEITKALPFAKDIMGQIREIT